MTDYAAITDWVQYLRECMRDPAAHRELDPDRLEVDAGLSMLRGSLDGTPYAARMSDAVLELLAKGTPDEQRKLLQTSLAGATQLGARVASIAHRWRGGPLDDRIRTLLLRGLEAAPDDPQVLAALDEEARQGGERTIDALQLAAPYNTPWLAAHIALLTRQLDPDGKNLMLVALRTQPDKLPVLVDGIASAGTDWITRFCDGLSRAPTHVVERLRPVLATNPAFHGRIP
jgi:hypothetical protein